jgi:lipid II:glycine glycyltransferase (peptidoglycan interpeptide bridge formation enzyme)
MSAASEALVEQILQLEVEISRKSVAGEDTTELVKKREALHERLQETVEKLGEKKSLLKG